MSNVAATPPGGMALPLGFRVQLREDLRISSTGTVIVGGTPLRVLRLQPRAAAVMRNGEVVVTDETSRAVATRLLEADVAVPIVDEVEVDPDSITVVIPVRERADSLDTLLSLLRPELRCVVIDDASLDRASIASVCRLHDVELVPLAANVGPAAARNIGLRRVPTRLVAFVDSDVRVTPADLLALSRHFTDPGLAAVAPRVIGRAPEAGSRWFERYGVERGSLDLGHTASLVREGAAVSYLPSACLVAVTGRLGEGFDPRLRVGEDVDLVWRIDATGWRVRYDPDIIAEHDTRRSIRAWLGRTYVYGTSGAQLAERHGDRIAPAVLYPAYLVGAVAMTAQRGWSLPVAAAAVGYTSLRVRASLGDVPARDATAARLALQGFGWTLRQESALLLRHWWPLTAVAFVFSSRLRRAAFAAVLVDVIDRCTAREVSWPEYLLGRRLEDLAYGAGLWAGALRARSARALTPRLVLPRRPPIAPGPPAL